MRRPSGTQAGDRRPWALLAGVLALSLAVRVVYVLQSAGSPAVRQPSMDALYHLEWARAFSRGETFQPGPFFRAPLYPWFLGLLLHWFGEQIQLVRLVQAGIGTASVGLVHAIATRAFDRRTGLLAALFAGLTWVVVYFEGELLLPVLEVFFDLLAIWLSLRIVGDEPGSVPSPVRSALAGAGWGVAAIVRPNVLLFAPVVLVWVLLRAPRHRTARILAPLAFLLGLAAPIAPITAHNALVGGDRVLISSQGGVNFWIGNNPQSDGQSAIVPGTRPDWWGGYHDSIAQAEGAEGRPLRPSEVSRYYARRAWDWVRTEPGAALAHTLWKLRLFWLDWELSNNASERFFAYRFGPVLRLLPVGFGFLAPMALLGLLLAARRVRDLLPLWGFLPVYMASVVAFFVCSRFRVPVLPVMAILAAHACFGLLELARARRLRVLALAAAFLAVMVAVVETIPGSIDRSDAKGLWQLGVFALQRGEPETAVERFGASIAIDPHFSTAHQDLGIALGALGRAAEAETSLRRAIALDPGNVVARSALVDRLLRDGRLEEAEPAARDLVERAPLFAPGRYDLGRVHYAAAERVEREGGPPEAARARLESAVAAFLEGLRLARDGSTRFRCGFAAGRAQRRLGRPEQATSSYQAALAAEKDPAGLPEEDRAWWWQCQRELLEVLASQGKREEVRARQEELMRRFPTDPRARALGSGSGAGG